MNEKDICFENIIGAIRGIPVIENDLIGENTVVLINKKTGAGKIIEHEVRIHQLEKENKDLKAINESQQTDIGLYLNSIKKLQDKLSKIKYLDRDEVKQIFQLWQSRGYLREDSYINAICNLAINRDRIIEVIKNHAGVENYYVIDSKGNYAGVGEKYYQLNSEDIEQIANEILNNKE
jgi:hypothetical protein